MDNRKKHPVRIGENRHGHHKKAARTHGRPKNYDQFFPERPKSAANLATRPGAYNFGVNDDGLIQAALDENKRYVPKRLTLYRPTGAAISGAVFRPLQPKITPGNPPLLTGISIFTTRKIQNNSNIYRCESPFITKQDISDIEAYTGASSGIIRPLPVAEVEKFGWEKIRLFMHVYGLYTLPTVELIDYLAGIVCGKRAIEIGAGMGVIGRSLGIPITDSRMQELPEVKSILRRYTPTRHPLPGRRGKAGRLCGGRKV